MSEQASKYEKFRLTPAIARAWYGNSLVGGTPASEPTAPAAKPVVTSRPPVTEPEPVATKHEVLVFHRAMLEQDREAGMQFLTNVLKACKLSLHDVALFEGPGPGDLETLRTTCNPRAMILFGIDPPATGLPLHVPHFQVMEHGGIKIISAPPMEELVHDKQLKTALWTGLQKIFNT